VRSGIDPTTPAYLEPEAVHICDVDEQRRKLLAARSDPELARLLA